MPMLSAAASGGGRRHSLRVLAARGGGCDGTMAWGRAGETMCRRSQAAAGRGDRAGRPNNLTSPPRRPPARLAPGTRHQGTTGHGGSGQVEGAESAEEGREV